MPGNTIIAMTGLLLGTWLAVELVGATSADKLFYSQQLRRFEQMSEEQRGVVLKSYALLKSQPEHRQAEIRAIHQQTRSDPELRDALQQYNAWRSGLSLNDRDTFRDLGSDEKFEFLKQRWTTAVELPRQEITVQFSGPASARMPELHLTFDEFWKIISATIPEPARNEKLQNELSSLTSDRHRALRLTLFLFEITPANSSPGEMEARGEMLLKAILENVHDKAWTDHFRSTMKSLERRPYARPWLFVTLLSILDSATVALGDDLRKQFPVSREEILSAFDSLQTGSAEDRALQRSLMTMSASEARKKLEMLAQTRGTATPEEQLLAKYNSFLQTRSGFLRGPFAFGGSAGARGTSSDRSSSDRTSSDRTTRPTDDGGRSPREPQRRQSPE